MNTFLEKVMRPPVVASRSAAAAEITVSGSWRASPESSRTWPSARRSPSAARPARRSRLLMPGKLLDCAFLKSASPWEATTVKVAALAGGVGGAKLLVGLQRALPEGALSAIVNTGDDASFYDVHVSPDVDIVTYWLAGVADFE